MIETIIKCDECKKSGSKHYKYTAGKEMDSSGNGYNKIWFCRDFCWDCLLKFVRNNRLVDIYEYQ